MRTNKASEAVLAKYSPPPKNKMTASFTSRLPKKKGATLEELYREVHARNALRIEHVYNNKNAQEIESMMTQNRRLIEAHRAPKR
jgi:hypothetical protein